MSARFILCCALGAVTIPAAAEDLVQVYRDAQRYDAQYAAAREAREAGKEKLPQGRALLLPVVGLTGFAQRQRINSAPIDPSLAQGFRRYPHSLGYTLSFSQPIFRPQNWYQYDQAGYQVKLAEAQFSQAGQDLIVRVAQTYFDVLAAQDTLELVRAQKAAISEQLAQAKRNFEVGTATITDTHEAQARFDLNTAQEIAAQNDLENKRRALQLVAGKAYPQIKPLRADVKLSPPDPSDMEIWAELSQKQSYPVLVQEATTEIASLEAKRNSAAHLPTLDLVASHGFNEQTGTIFSGFGNDLTNTTIGLQMALPLYQGGALTSRDRETAALSRKSKDDLDNARRSSALASRQSYLSVINGIAQVAALEQALTSSQSALDSNKLGYEVGVRINIDVLNAQQQLYSTKRDLALARYNTITNHLRLKAAAGSLRQDDLEEVNRALQP